MKKFKSLKLVMATLLMGLCMALPTMNLRAEDPPQDDPNPDILRGYTPTTKKVVVGYHLEHYGWIGGHFSKIVRDYEFIRCCKATFQPMDGCSVGVKCESIS